MFYVGGVAERLRICGNEHSAIPSGHQEICNRCHTMATAKLALKDLSPYLEKFACYHNQQKE